MSGATLKGKIHYWASTEGKEFTLKRGEFLCTYHTLLVVQYYRICNILVYYTDEFSATGETEATALIVMQSAEYRELLHCGLSTPFASAPLRNKITRNLLIKRIVLHMTFPLSVYVALSGK
jgi:hypothetical protein